MYFRMCVHKQEGYTGVGAVGQLFDAKQVGVWSKNMKPSDRGRFRACHVKRWCRAIMRGGGCG